MRPSSSCPKCGGSMAEGFVVDQGYGSAHVSTWQQGEPRKSIWFGVKQSKSDQLEVCRGAASAEASSKATRSRERGGSSAEICARQPARALLGVGEQAGDLVVQPREARPGAPADRLRQIVLGGVIDPRQI